MKVQTYLQNNGLEALRKKHIKIVEEGPLAILNYDQLESSKSDPIANECRGLTIEKGTWKIIARAMIRFFTWGEMKSAGGAFNWDNFTTTVKEDGSLILVYFYEGRWRVNTRGSFGGQVHDTKYTWSELVWSRLNADKLIPGITYVFELATPHNTVIRKYNDVNLFLLTAFRGLEEMTVEEVHALNIGVQLPTLYKFTSIQQIEEFLLHQEMIDPTFEGVVVRDDKNNRWKFKTGTYLGYAHLWSRGEFNEKRLLPFILAGNDSILIDYPEAESRYRLMEKAILEQKEILFDLWEDNKDIVDAREFAKKVSNNPFCGILFALRKSGGAFGLKWRKSQELIMKWWNVNDRRIASS